MCDRMGDRVLGMQHPAWILVPWAVFALAAAIKVWRLWGTLRRRLVAPASGSERFRQSLERIWQRDSLTQG